MVKFYFCEGCGKRITEKDVDAGAARNKKLKGVYCSVCAVGVTTMESLPVSDDEAKKILENESARTAASDQGSGVRRPATSSRRERRSSARVEPIGGKKSSAPFVVGGVAAALLIPVLLLLLSAEQPDPPREESASNALKGTRETGESEEKSPAGPQKRTDPPTQPLTPDKTSFDMKDWVKLQRDLEALPVDDLAGRLRVAEPALARLEPGKQKEELSERIRSWRQQLSEAAQPPVATEKTTQEHKGGSATRKEEPRDAAKSEDPPKADPDKASSESITTPASQDDLKLAGIRIAFSGELELLFEKLRFKEFDSARAFARNMASNEALGEWKAAAAGLPKSLDLLEKHTRVREEALKKHIGKTIIIKTAKGPRRGKVVDAKSDSLKMRRVFRINNQERLGNPFEVMLSECPAAERKRLLGPVPKATTDDRIASAINALANGNTDVARTELELCAETDHVLKAPLAWKLKQVERINRENDAEAAWQRISQAAAAKMDEKKVQTLLTALTEFRERFRKTELFGRVQADVRRMEGDLGGRVYLSREVLASAIRGNLTRFDKATNRTEITYTFDAANQLLDFDGDPGPATAIANGRLVLSDNAEGRRSYLLFGTKDLDISVKLVDLTGTLCVGLCRQGGWHLRLSKGSILLTGVGEEPRKHPVTGLGSGAVCRIQSRNRKLLVHVNGRKALEAKVLKPVATGFYLRAAGQNVALDDLKVHGIPRSWWAAELNAEAAFRSDRKAPLNRWVKKSGDGSWSDAQNWSLGRAPQEGDRVLFPGGSSATCRAAARSVPSKLAGLMMGKHFKGTVILEPGFGKGEGGKLALENDLALLGGKLSMSGTEVEQKRKAACLQATNVVVGHRAVLSTDMMGSRKTGGKGAAGRSGGDLDINCSGTIAMNGILTSNGQDIVEGTRTKPRCIGGSGGRSRLSCNVFSGRAHAQVRARGGRAAGYKSTGGSGGHVSISSNRYRFAGMFELEGAPGATEGTVGTLSLPAGADLRVVKPVRLPSGTHKLGRVVVQRGGRLICDNRWNPDGNAGTHDGMGCVINADEFNVMAGGLVTASGRGYPPRHGPGAHKDKMTRSAAGTHGGKGGNSPKKPYGSATEPCSLGSGGYYAGGGAIKIDVPEGKVIINGIISADGTGSDSMGSYDRDGGAGGSMWIIADEFQGAGRLSANGGDGVHTENSDGGGGGRIAVHFRKKSFTGTIEAKGGKGREKNGIKGEDGTVVLKERKGRK